MPSIFRFEVMSDGAQNQSSNQETDKIASASVDVKMSAIDKKTSIDEKGGSYIANSPSVAADHTPACTVDNGQYQTVEAGPSVISEEEEVVICSIQTDSMFKIPVEVNSVKLEAIVDTAAQVTIISDRLYRQFKPQPQVLGNVQLNTAGRNMTMRGFVTGPVTMVFGNSEYQIEVYVAPMGSDMLLGLDFMMQYGGVVSLPENHFRIGKDVIPRIVTEMPDLMLPVTVRKTTVIPPNTMGVVPCGMEKDINVCLIEPSGENRLIIPRMVHRVGNCPNVHVINVSGTNVVLKQGLELASAHPAEVVTPIPEEVSEVFQTFQDQHGNETSEEQVSEDLPAHLQGMYQQSIEHLDNNEKSQLQNLLIEFQDVFARDEFDLGNFTEVEHAIDTDGARPVKQ